MENTKYSMKEILKQKYGEAEKSSMSKKATKRATRKTNNSSGKYITKIVDGVKYMILKN